MLLNNRYQILSTVSKNAISTVFKAFDTKLYTLIALKLYSNLYLFYPEDIDQMEREALILSDLNHQNIVKYLNHFQENGSFALVMELAVGISLSDVITWYFGPIHLHIRPRDVMNYINAEDENVLFMYYNYIREQYGLARGNIHQMSDLLIAQLNLHFPALVIDFDYESLVVALFQQLLSAVAHIHYHSAMHRDVKPDNIIIVEENGTLVLKLLDFGSSVAYNMADSVVGTLGFIAPELAYIEAKGGPKYSNAVDAWSLGSCLFASIHGIPPVFVTRNVKFERLYAQLGLTLPIRPDCNWAIRASINGLLRRSPDDRMDVATCKATLEYHIMIMENMWYQPNTKNNKIFSLNITVVGELGCEKYYILYLLSSYKIAREMVKIVDMEGLTVLLKFYDTCGSETLRSNLCKYCYVVINLSKNDVKYGQSSKYLVIKMYNEREQKVIKYYLDNHTIEVNYDDYEAIYLFLERIVLKCSKKKLKAVMCDEDILYHIKYILGPQESRFCCYK